MSFGATKNGGLLADAIVVFSPDAARDIAFHLRRAGLVWSKMRFAAAQLMAYVEDDLWLRLAGQANAAAARLAADIGMVAQAQLLAPVEANELFVEMAPAGLTALEEDGFLFYRRGPRLARFVCRWDTTEEETLALGRAIARHAGA
jgi:threonine aldolase